MSFVLRATRIGVGLSAQAGVTLEHTLIDSFRALENAQGSSSNRQCEPKAEGKPKGTMNNASLLEDKGSESNLDTDPSSSESDF